MATINPSQDYDIIHTLTYESSGGTGYIELYRGSGLAFTGTVYYRAGTSGAWTSLAVSGSSTNFPITSTTMQIAHDWNKSGNDYMTPGFDGGTMTSIAVSQKAPLSGIVGSYFMYYYAYNCTSLTTLDVPDTSGLTSVGNNFMVYYAYHCSSLTTLDVPDTSSLTSVGSYFMYYYAADCTNLTTLAIPNTSGLTSVSSNFMCSYAIDCTSLTTLEAPNTSGLTSVGNYFMIYYAYSCTSLTTLDVPDTSGLASAGDSFVHGYAGGCTSLTTLGVPDTSGLTSASAYFMNNYASGCTSLTTLAIPNTSGLTSVSTSFMSYYAEACTSLTQLMLPAAGWFKTNNINWSVPSGLLNILKGYVLNSADLADWQALTVSGKTLYTNYIRSNSDVFSTPNIGAFLQFF